MDKKIDATDVMIDAIVADGRKAARRAVREAAAADRLAHAFAEFR